jgi:DNA-binding GntR family transcriptional regulator
MKSASQTLRREAKGDSSRVRAAARIAAPPILSGPERDTLQLRVYRALANGLKTGMFKPGEAVTLRSLATRLGTSAMPVREAVSRLIAERALVLLPNRSVIVPRVSCAQATPALVRRLSEINDAMKHSLAIDDLHGALSQNTDFHFLLYRAARQEVILPLIEMLWLQAGPFLALSLLTPGAGWTARYHQAVIAALRGGQGVAARRAIAADIEETTTQLLKRAVFDEEAPTVPLNGSGRIVELRA